MKKPENCSTDYLRPTQRDFREAHTAKSIRTQKLEIESTMIDMDIDDQHGTDLVGEIITRKHEAKSAHYKMRNAWEYSAKNEVPSYTKQIARTDFSDPLLGKKFENFSRHKQKNKLFGSSTQN